MLDDWRYAPWWKKFSGVLACILVLLIITGGLYFGVEYFGDVSKTHRWLSHIPAIILIVIYSFIATSVVIATYEGIYRANPLPMRLNPDDLAIYQAERDKRQSRALMKTCFVVCAVAIALYFLRFLR